MNSKSKKKTKITAKSYAFWSVVCVIVLTLLVILTINIFQLRDVSSYDKLEEVKGNAIYTQEESSYLVLFYDFSGSEAMEFFDNTMFQYLTYYRDNSSSATTKKIYKAVSTNHVNKLCIGTGSASESRINNTTTFPSSLNATGSTVLFIQESQLPILLVVNNKTITDYKSGETEILTYIQGLMK